MACDRVRSWLRLPPHSVPAHDAHDALRRWPKPQLGSGKQAVDDVGGAVHAVVDEGRLAVGADDEEWRCFALRKARRKLDVDLRTIVEDLGRLPGCVALDAIAEPQLLDIDTGI